MADETKLPGRSTFTNTALADLRSALAESEAESTALLSAGFPTAGLGQRMYALEIAVKILICEHLDLDLLPLACKTHDLSLLIAFTGRNRAIRSEVDPILTRHWEILEAFSKQHLNDLRYRPSSEAEVGVVASLMEALDDPEHGVMTWLRKCLSP